MRIIYSGIDEYLCKALRGFPGGLDGKESVCNAGDPGLIPGLGRSLGEGNGYPLQYSGLESLQRDGHHWATFTLKINIGFSFPHTFCVLIRKFYELLLERSKVFVKINLLSFTPKSAIRVDFNI